MFEYPSFRLLVIIAAAIMTIMYTTLAYRFILKRKPSFRSDLMKMLPAAFAILASMVVVIITFVERTNDTGSFLFMSSQDRKLQELSQNFAEFEPAIKILRAKLDALPRISDQNTIYYDATLAEIQTTLTKHDNALKKFESLVMSEPEKLITLPLMQRDFQNLQNDISTVKARINDLSLLITETASQNRWVIGTLALGILALVLPVIKSTFTTSGKGQEKSEEK